MHRSKTTHLSPRLPNPNLAMNAVYAQISCVWRKIFSSLAWQGKFYCSPRVQSKLQWATFIETQTVSTSKWIELQGTNLYMNQSNNPLHCFILNLIKQPAFIAAGKWHLEGLQICLICSANSIQDKNRRWKNFVTSFCFLFILQKSYIQNNKRCIHIFA